MELKIYRHLWGVAEPWGPVYPKIKALGYDGIETSLPGEGEEKAFRDELASHGFAYMPMLFTGGASVNDHLQSFRSQLHRASALGVEAVTSHSGQDGFSVEDSLKFFREAVRMEQDAGVRVGHETHRGRILFNPWIARQILSEVEGVSLCADFSHWVCVCERMLTREADIVKLAASRTIHVHARVGYEQGPQVPDPRAPEYESYLSRHESWWDLVWAAQRARGVAVSTLTPEFGPPNYMHLLPYTRQPVADLWEICNWQAARQRERFNRSRM